MIAEESTAWPMVTRPPYIGGLGFHLKWDMGWMHDTLEYMQMDPFFRSHHHNTLTFRQVYATTENFVLALSHDEVVHGKRSLVGKMPGDWWKQFANLRALYGYMYGLPGKKLLFMGDELAQWAEWNHDAELDWALEEKPPHLGVKRYVADLNTLYAAEPALHELDTGGEGFAWIDCHDHSGSTLTFTRKDRKGDIVVVLCNFTPLPRPGFRIGVPRPGTWRELLNGDDEAYGGSGIVNAGALETEEVESHGQPCALTLTVPPLAVVFLKAPPADASVESD
jgi:1,4-alpha-glucan branching enzyme